MNQRETLLLFIVILYELVGVLLLGYNFEVYIVCLEVCPFNIDFRLGKIQVLLGWVVCSREMSIRETS